MRRRHLGSAVLVAAVAGLIALSALGRATPVRPAEAQEASPAVELNKAHAGSTPALTGDKPIFILLLGDNYRDKIEESHLTDSIHVVGINPARRKATIVGIPRDAYVSMPGQGSGKINEAYEFGGAKLAIATIEDLTGLTMDYYAVTGFEGFREMVTDVGGVDVVAPYAINDSHSKANVKKGKNHLDGKQALAYVRSRYDVPNGDFSRSENQGHFLISMLTQFQKQYRADPSVFIRYLAAIVANIETDVSYDELIALGFTAQQIPAKGIKNLVTPGTLDTVNGASVVRLTSGADKIFKKMQADGLA